MAKKVCKYCGKEFDSRGLRLHQLTCKENPINADEKETIHKVVEPECNHPEGFKLLNVSIPDQKACIDAGYTKYCPICFEVV